ncbi:MAG TPA: ABC transporter substrate-binding protein [Aeromicrobium sp.]|nr:ABC transporter substrate-binding protein [Aeromicrobium sp.]HKY57495.1 ABC transporter substrate-binding protein [Aeromicrobium sp.]
MRLRHLTLALAVALGVAACGGDPTKQAPVGDSETITIGSAAFPENEIIAEIYAEALESKGIVVDKKLNIGAREVYIPALENGEIDLIPEYTGNLLTYLDPKATATAPDEVTAALAKAVPKGLTVLDPAPAEDKDSLNVTAAFAKENGTKTIADLSKVDGLRLAANPEFKQRAYGIPGLEKVYGITGIEFTPISDGGGPATVKALVSGKVDVADIYSTTPSIRANKLVTLDDPKNLIAAQNVVPFIREGKATADVIEVLDAVSAALTTDDLLELNAANQGEDKKSPSILAKEWVADNLK